MLVLADADLDLAARAAAFGLRLNNGATCIAPRRAIVHRSLIEQFEARLHALLERAPRQNAGNPLAARLAQLFRDAEMHGGHFLVGGLTDGVPQLPTVVTFRSTGAALLDADVFAPVMSLLAADSDEHALALAAQSSYGLGASIFSRDPVRAADLARALPVGVVTINDVIAPTADARLPFGGRLRSGFGVTRGAEGLLEMTAPKVVAARAGRFRPHHLPPEAADGELAVHLMQSTHGGGLLQRLRSRFQLLRVVLRRATKRPNSHNPS
jgi:acyl-CoA reductase-like NAD-dependent aldehyde dehydrogenase